jgi:putative endopeptidase
MKKILLFILALCLYFPVFGAVFAETATSDEVGEAAENDIVLNDGTPWIDYCLRENIAQVDQKPDSPKDDFFLWADYDWLKSAEIAQGNYYTDAFLETEEEVMDQCLEVLTDPTLKSGDAALAQYLYKACLDWDARNALGVAPLQKIIDRIRAVSTLDELTQMLGSEDYTGFRFFQTDIATSFNHPGIWITDIRPIDLLLEDSAEYRERTGQGELLEAAYTEMISKMLEKLGYSPEEAAGMITRAFALETELADGIKTSAEEMSPDFYRLINNEMSRAEAETLCSAFPWLEILDGRGWAGVQRYRVQQPAYLQKLDGIYREDRLEDLKDFLIARTADLYMLSLDRESYDLIGTLYSVYGIEGIMPDEEIACRTVRQCLPAQTANAFFEKHDPAKMKADITRLCEEVIDYYRKMLSGEDWLTEETRAKAIEKLDKMRIVAVCPEKWPDYSGLSFEGLGYFDCLQEIDQAELAFIKSLADQPADPDLWYSGGEDSWANDILLCTAAYGAEINTIFVSRGILGGVFYREDMSEEELYGAIGLVIAHEISHAFDPTCSQFDADGKMNNWWTEADYAAFDARAKKVIDYYNGITVFSGLQVSGDNVQGEAIADLGGMKCMLSLLEEKKEDVDYRTFFESFARIWREIITWEGEYYNLLQDPHPPTYLRTNTVVQQVPQFFETYGITEGDGMWLKPEDRIQVW